MRTRILDSDHSRLHKLGFAIHLLHSRSKRPVEMGWASGSRKSWPELKASYQSGMNVGVRLGSASKIGGQFLAVIDCDVKSSDPAHVAEMETRLGELFQGTAPVVFSGRGNGSRHIYVLTREPARAKRLAQSPEKVKVHMPSATSPSKFERENLTAEELATGIRLRAAWEIALMGEGQQVVLPPSIHPDTGSPYAWEVPLGDALELPIFEISQGKNVDRGVSVKNDFKPVSVDLVGSSLPDRIVNQILSGDGVEDRSGALLGVSNAMLRAGFSDVEILSVLTDPENFLGQTGYDHAQTRSRARAAEWIRKYTLEKSKSETLAEEIFRAEVEEAPILSDEEAAAHLKEACPEPDDWRLRLKRGGADGMGPPKSLLENVVLVLTKAISPKIFIRDEFAMRDFYGCDTPWGGVKGASLTDEDAAKISLWLGENFRFEPSKDRIFDAMTVIAAQNAFDPVRDWLDTLPEWDGVIRLDRWLRENFEAEGDEEYLAQVFRKWLVAMVMRIYRPGAKFDWMPIFEGPQGVGKSSFGRLLVGDGYFLDWLPDLADKDSALSLQGAWGVELGELASLRKNEIETVKAFITRTVDKIRPPYGRKVIESPRRCVFFGTTNAETYLRDDTGNRRFKPVKVGKLDFSALERDRVQLFAEARFLYLNELEDLVNLDLDGSAREYALRIQAEKMVEDESTIMRDQLQGFIEEEKRKPPGDRFNFEKFSILDLFSGIPAIQGYPLNARNQMFAAKALKYLGAVKRKSDGRSFWRLSGIPRE